MKALLCYCSVLGMLLALVLLPSPTTIVRADPTGTLAVDSTGGEVIGALPGSLTLGYSFELDSSVVVETLLLFGSRGDGFLESHEVGIWDASSQTLLGSGSFEAGAGAPTVESANSQGDFRVVDVPDFVLPAGTYVIGATFSPYVDGVIWVATAIVADGVTFGGARYSDPGGSPGLAFPDTLIPGGDDGFFGPSLTFVPAGGPIVVNGIEDVINPTDGQCTLREAIIAANTNLPSGNTAGECAVGEAAPTVDTIAFDDLPGSPDLYTLTLAGRDEDAAGSGDLDITEELTLCGNGQAETIIQAGTDKTNGIDRVFEVFADATFENVTIRHGRAIGDQPSASGSGIYNHDGTVNLTNSTVSGNSAGDCGGGGGISNGGTLNLTNSTVSGNSGGWTGGGIHNGSTLNLTNSTVSGNSVGDVGGGIYNEGTAILTNSTVSGNVSHLAGGGIFSRDTLNLTNSTVSGNSASQRSGGISNSGTATLTNSTVSGNDSGDAGGGICSYGTLTLINSTVSGNDSGLAGGGIYNLGTANLSNTIIASQLAGGDCSGTITSHGYNLDSDGTCGLGATGDISGGNANLGPLQLNAPGNTATHALLPSSPAIDHIPSGSNGCGSTIINDQCGVSRPQDGDGAGGAACDIGAYEQQESTLIELVSFDAHVAGDAVAVTWETGSEVDNAGFNVYRAAGDGTYVQVNEALIPAQGDPVGGASYSLQDAPGYGTFYYKLEDVDLSGVRTEHGPVVVVVKPPFRLPLVRPVVPF